MRTALAISPHLDDAAFSAGATLARLARRGWRVIVATVFTRTVPDPQGFALACQTGKGLPPEADYMAIRRAEDEAACAALGATAYHLPFAEAPHRGYEDAPSLFAEVRADDLASEEIGPALSTLIAELAPTLLLGPRGIGAHVDHVVVRKALDALPRPRTLLWTDWPYAGRTDALDPFGPHDAAARRLAVPVQDQDAKLAACAAYSTQLGFQFGGAAGMAASVRLVATERFVVSPELSGCRLTLPWTR